jgi:hypothetical protein
MTRMSRLRSVVWMSLAVLVAYLAASVQPASAAPVWILSDIVFLQNAKSGQCMAIPSGTTTNGTAAIQWPCNRKTEQLWLLYYDQNDGLFKIVNHATNKCLGVGGGNGTPGRNIIQWPCNDSTTDQKWVVTPCEPGDQVCIHIRRKDLFLCMAIGGGSSTNGAKVIQWDCNYSNSDQKWAKF